MTSHDKRPSAFRDMESREAARAFLGATASRLEHVVRQLSSRESKTAEPAESARHSETVTSSRYLPGQADRERRLAELASAWDRASQTLTRLQNELAKLAALVEPLDKEAAELAEWQKQVEQEGRAWVIQSDGVLRLRVPTSADKVVKRLDVTSEKHRRNMMFISAVRLLSARLEVGVRIDFPSEHQIANLRKAVEGFPRASLKKERAARPRKKNANDEDIELAMQLAFLTLDGFPNVKPKQLAAAEVIVTGCAPRSPTKAAQAIARWERLLSKARHFVPHYIELLRELPESVPDPG